MPAPSGSKRRAGTGAVLAVLALAGAAPAPRDFDRTFATAGEPRQLHYRVLYRGADGLHRLEVWRDGDRQVKRVTDGLVTTLARHQPGSADFTMQVVDPRKHTSTRIDRASLYRVGNFTDWFDLGHGLRHPKGQYRLIARAPLMPMPRTPAPCRWYDLSEPGRTTSICWDEADRLPLLIAAGPGRPVWRVLALDRRALASTTFRTNDHGYIHDDATRDISGD